MSDLPQTQSIIIDQHGFEVQGVKDVEVQIAKSPNNPEEIWINIDGVCRLLELCGND